MPIGPLPEGRQGQRSNITQDFWIEYTQYVSASLLTVSITGLDLIADWFMFNHIIDLDLQSKVKNQSKATNSGDETEVHQQLRTFYANLSVIFQSIIYAATTLILVYFIWIFYTFYAKKQIIKDKWDGIPKKSSVSMKYGHEIFSCIITLVHNLAISVLLFIVQLAVSCRFIFYTDNLIFAVAISTTLASLSWKILQMIWFSGCLGHRDYDTYYANRPICTLRIVSLLIIVCSFTLASWNLVLVTGWKTPTRYHGNMLNNIIMDKIKVDSWTRNTHVMLALEIDDSGTNFSAQESDTRRYQLPNMTLFNLQDIVGINENVLHNLSIPCNSSDLHNLLNISDRQENCSLDIQLRVERAPDSDYSIAYSVLMSQPSQLTFENNVTDLVMESRRISKILLTLETSEESPACNCSIKRV